MSEYPAFYDDDFHLGDEGRSQDLPEFGMPPVQESSGFTAEGIEIGELNPSSGTAPAAEPDDELSANALRLTEHELDRVTNDMIALFDNVYDPNLLDPVLYINDSIRQMVDDSSASDELKNRIDALTSIDVSFRHRPAATSGLIDASTFLGPRETQKLRLDEIVTDSYRRLLDDHHQVQIDWPAEFPQDLIAKLESANLQANYQADVERRLSTADARFMLKLQSMVEVQNRLEQYANRADAPQVYRHLAHAYGRGEARLERVQFRSRTWQVDVAQVLYLRLKADPSSDGLLIFLDATEDDAIVPLAQATKRWFIESSPRLRRLILQRLPLYNQILHGNRKLHYVNSYFGPQVTSVSPLQFRPDDDVFEALHSLRIKRMLSNIDTLVSTDSERLTDKFLEAGASILQGLSIVATLPVGGGGGLAARLLVSFLLGQGSAALEAVRGAIADIPEQAEAHYKSALYTAIAEITGPLAQKLLGKAVSTVNKTHISTRVFKHLNRTRLYPGKASSYDRITPAPTEVKRIKTEVAAQLSGGPQQAQRLVDRSGRLLNKTVEGHDLVVYRGKVFRGDMRPPEEIFEKGFELRTPAAEIQKDIHQVTGVRGGFGGGHDALDIDGRGISTSAYYYRENVGAFVYGGQKGGYTYVIDARRFDGYHLYQNHHNALYPHTAKKIKFKPTEINYANNIPPGAILGAYDALGNFIANNTALRVYARGLAIKEIRRLAASALSAGAKKPPSEDS
ncbi:hypothetical protein [Pseudomonas sp. LP_7_YM]|uniref:hypothetical protein n=1 Tax=Pseudomonas sp. LP_7_YM TaxID=2485137 RepID=UPI00105C5BA7|nr:hypothetical protein [Pseudomonas sp. LP_7_YM]TDV69841.1 hypothetical protein EC915_10299 [Pseudomonas sp. LP_7_YM]